VELRGFEPRTFSLRRRSRPHQSPVYALHKLRADRHGAPVPSAGGTGGHAIDAAVLKQFADPVRHSVRVRMPEIS
jgi:hypothetical protein